MACLLKRRRRALLVSTVLVLSILTGLAVLQRLASPVHCVTDSSESYFNSFDIRGGSVYFDCYVTFVNQASTNKSFVVWANSPTDQSSGLLQNSKMRLDNMKAPLTLKANETRQFHMVFVGEHGNNYQKSDRLLPEIEVQIVR